MSNKNSISNSCQSDIDTDSQNSIPVQRRDLMAAFGASVASSLSGCNIPFSNNNSSGDGTTAQEVDIDEESELNTALEIRLEQTSTSDELTPEVTFGYETVDVRESGGRIVATPLSGVQADQVIVYNPDGPSLQTQRGAVLAMFGAPIEEVYAVEAIQERDIKFIGGAGDEIMIAAGIAPISYLGRSLLIGRAEVADTLDSVIGSFDDFINENLSG